MILLFNHTLTEAQKADAKISLGVEDFVALPHELQNIWSNVPPEIESLKSLLVPIRAFVQKEAKEGDHILIQGDFGATCQMVKYAKSLGLIPVYATTKREVVEVKEDDKVIKKSLFKHERFRRYED